MAGLALAGALLFASQASADSLSFDAKATNGYEIAVRADFQGEDGSVQIDLTKTNRGNHRSSFKGAYYYLDDPIKLSRRRIVADLGPRGLIDLTFQRGRGSVPTCQNHGVVFGEFRGLVDIHGEHRFSSFTEQQVRGELFRGEKCPPPPQARKRNGRAILLACDPGHDLYYSARKFRDFALHDAAILRHRAGLEAIRFVTKFGRGSFHVSPKRHRATVDPPSPFTGVGRFHGSHLHGDLAVTLPGMTEPHSLAGARAALGNRDARRLNCRNGRDEKLALGRLMPSRPAGSLGGP